jgi:hypothetical protein
MSNQYIQSNYWKEFLIWYSNYKDPLVATDVSSERYPAVVEDLFWYWLCHVKALQEGEGFLQNLDYGTNSPE